jgi:hypothetical protein
MRNKIREKKSRTEFRKKKEVIEQQLFEQKLHKRNKNIISGVRNACQWPAPCSEKRVRPCLYWFEVNT